MKHSSDMFTNDTKLLIPGKRNTQYSKNAFVDLTTDALLDEKASKELIAPCSVKKPRLLKIGSDLNQKHSVVKSEPLGTPYAVLDSVIHERPHITLSGRMKNVQDGTKLLLEGALAAQKSSTEFISQKNKADRSSPAPCEDEEKKGSTFLTQVSVPTCSSGSTSGVNPTYHLP